MAVSKMPGWTGSAPNRPIPIRNISQLCSPFVTLFLRNMYTHMYVYVYLYILYLKLKHCIHKKTIWVFKKRKITQAHQKKNCDGDISVVSPGMSLEGWRRQCVRIAESASRKRLGCVLTMRPKNGVGVGGKPRVYCRDFSRVSNIKLFGFYNLHIVDGRNPKEPPFGWCWNAIDNWDNHHPWCRIFQQYVVVPLHEMDSLLSLHFLLGLVEGYQMNKWTWRWDGYHHIEALLYTY